MEETDTFEKYKQGCNILLLYNGSSAYIILESGRKIYGAVEVDEKGHLKVDGIAITKEDPIDLCKGIRVS
jgi:hypothetical protein